MSVKENVKRINFNVDKDLHMQFRIKTLEKSETMSDVLIRAIEEYIES